MEPNDRVISGEISDTPNVSDEEIEQHSKGPLTLPDRYIKAAGVAAKVEIGLSRGAKIWLKLQAAADYGLSPSQAMRGLWVNPDSGVVMPTSLLLGSLVRREPDCLFFECVQSDRLTCRWKGIKSTNQGPIEYIAEYSVDRAKEEIRGYERKQNWRNTVAMLQHRARWECAQTLWPHLVMGAYFPKTQEE